MKALEKFQNNKERPSKFMKHQELKDDSIYCVLETSEAFSPTHFHPEQKENIAN